MSKPIRKKNETKKDYLVRYGKYLVRRKRINARNSEKRKAYRQKYNAAHKDENAEKCRKYYEEHRHGILKQKYGNRHKRTIRLLHTAQTGKDEFYTRLVDIENELAHYESYLKGKRIYLPCDSEKSNFLRYFTDNFDRLEIRHLTATCISGMRFDFDGKTGTSMEIGNGDFRGGIAASIIAESDVVVTNPPWSMFDEFLNWILDNGKDCIIIGNLNSAAHKTVWKHFMDGKIRFGHKANGKAMMFEVPEEYQLNGTEIDDEKRLVAVPGGAWYTTFPVVRPWIKLNGNKDKLNRFDNYDAANVDAVSEIPDIDEVIGVPITFLAKRNEEQFVLIGMFKGNRGEGFVVGDEVIVDGRKTRNPVVKGKLKYCRVLIRRRIV